MRDPHIEINIFLCIWVTEWSGREVLNFILYSFNDMPAIILQKYISSLIKSQVDPLSQVMTNC